MSESNPKPRIAFIQRLCKDLPEEKIQEAEANFWAYLEIVTRIAVSPSATQVTHTPDSTIRDSEQ